MGSGGGGGAGVYFMGDSLERKSRREGSRSRRGSVGVVDVEEVLFQGHPIVCTIGRRIIEEHYANCGTKLNFPKEASIELGAALDVNKPARAWRVSSFDGLTVSS